MKTLKALAYSCMLTLASCGPQVGSSSGDEAGGEPGTSWAMGFFHNQETGTGQSRGLLQMFELRSDGTAAYFSEDCLQGVLGPHADFAWRALDDERVEVFPSQDESFQWIRGIQESVVLTRVEDGIVHANDNGSIGTTYARGKLCVTNRPPRDECPNGFDVEVCEE